LWASSEIRTHRLRGWTDDFPAQSVEENMLFILHNVPFGCSADSKLLWNPVQLLPEQLDIQVSDHPTSQSDCLRAQQNVCGTYDSAEYATWIWHYVDEFGLDLSNFLWVARAAKETH